MRCVAIRDDASMHIRGHIVADRNATDEKRIRVGQALISSQPLVPFDLQTPFEYDAVFAQTRPISVIKGRVVRRLSP